MKRKTNALETGFHLLFLGCGVLSVALVLLISVYLLLSGVPAMAKLGVGRFLFGESWSAGTGEFGIWPFILTSVYGTAGAVALGVPLGLLTAVYLAKDAPGWLAGAIHTAVELLSGIPSVVYGLVGMMVLVPLIQRVFALSSGACLLTAVLVLTIMILPYIISEVTVDDGAEEVKRLRLGGVRQNGSCLPEIDVTGNELGSFNWLIEKWGADCILEIGSTVKDSVRYAIQQTAHDADRCTVYQVTGWKKIAGRWMYLMPGREPPRVQLPDKLSRYEGAEEIDPEALPVLSYLLERPPAPKEVIWPLLAFTLEYPSYFHLYR